MTDLAFDSAGALARRIRDGELSAVELTEHFIRRIEAHDGTVNAVVVRDFDRALADARRADEALASGTPRGPLHGVPMTIKESYDVAGLPTTWGIPAFRDNVAESDAAVVQRLRAAGVHFIGKTNVPKDLADFQSYNDIYGTTGNPWDPSRTPGGSSGGSAAALAAGFTPLEAGSDIGGSIRNPAHFCGVYGHKPTWNVVPFQGHALPGMLAPPDIAVAGPMARSAADLALMLDVMAGPDHLHAPGWRLELPRPRRQRLSEFRVAVWPQDPRAPVSTEVADRAQALADRLAALGARVSDSARPDIDVGASHRIYLHLLWGVMTAGLPDDQFAAIEAQVRDLDADDDSDEAVTARASVQHHRDWLRHNNQREALRLRWRAFFEEWDILICPQMPTDAFPHDHAPFPSRAIMVNNESRPYFEQLFWAGLITASYLPSTVFPTGPSRRGLPIGLQAVSGEFLDYTCIEFARLLAEEWGGFTPPPGF